jgi:hypothetical protein
MSGGFFGYFFSKLKRSGNASVQISILKMLAGVSDLRLRGTLRIILHARQATN